MPYGYMPKDPLSESTRLAPLRILVVEDNVVNQTIAKYIMLDLGLETEIAEDGEVASEVLAQREFDIIFMDIKMPFKDGLEVVMEVRAGNGPNKDKPIIAMSAYSSDEDRQKCMAAGMDDYIRKPIKQEEVKEMLVTWGGN